MNLNAPFFKLTLFALALAILGCLFLHRSIILAWGISKLFCIVMSDIMAGVALGFIIRAIWISVKNKEDETEDEYEDCE